MDKPVVCLIHTGGERGWVERCKMRLQTSASVLCHEHGTGDSIDTIDGRNAALASARVVLLLLTPDLWQDPIFRQAEWPALLNRLQNGEIQLLPVWYADPDETGLQDLELLSSFDYWEGGVGDLEGADAEHALNQVVARVSDLLAQPLSPQDQVLFLDQIFDEYYESLLAYFRKHVEAEDARDLAQETFLRAIQGASAYRGRAHPRRWLYVVATNVLKNFRRHHSSRKRHADVESLDSRSDAMLEPKSPMWGKEPESPESKVLAGERQVQLQQAIEKLPPRMHEVVALRMSGLSYEEIAQRLGMSLQTVRSHLSQAKTRLVLAEEKDNHGDRDRK